MNLKNGKNIFEGFVTEALEFLESHPPTGVHQTIGIEQQTIKQSTIGMPVTLQRVTDHSYGIGQLPSDHPGTHKPKKCLDMSWIAGRKGRVHVSIISGL
jgi:hypothetical protein